MPLYRIAVTAILLAGFLALSAEPARAQGNPLGGAGGAGAASPRFFEGDGLILVIERTEEGGKRIEGRLIRGEQVFPCRATWESKSSARGSFSSGEQSFEFTAASQPDGSMVLRTGTASYTLKPVAQPSRPIPGIDRPKPVPVAPPLPAADPLTGRWTGTGSEPLNDGSTVEYVVSLEIGAGPGGRTAALTARTTVAMQDGSKADIQVTGQFQGTSAASLEFKAQDVTVRIDPGARIESIGAHRLILEPAGENRLNGRVGNMADGWTTLALTRRPGKAAVEPKPNPGPGTTVLPPDVKQQANLYSLIANLPGVSRLTAPEWAKPGARITLWSGSANINDQAFQTTLTPSATGDLVDPATGKRYSESSVPGGGGAVGFMQIDVTGVSPDLVVMRVSNFLHDGTMGRPSLIAMTQLVCHPSGCEYWIHPQALRLLAAQGGFVFAGRRKQGDQMREVVVVKNGNGHTVYDAASGVMLSFSMKTKSTGTETYYDPATKKASTRAKTGSMLVVNQFRSIRETYRTRLAGMKLPKIVDGLKGIEVDWRQTFRMDAAPDLPQMSSMKFRIEPIGRSGNWVVIRTTAQSTSPNGSAGAPQSVTAVTMPADVGGTFLPPDFLAGLKQGQVLDEDPLTGYSTRVTRVGRAGDGRPVVVITRGGATEKSDWIYDARSGMMISLYKFTRAGGSTTEVQANVIRTW